MNTEKRIFASPFDMAEQTKEERLQWAEDNGMVWSVDWFITSINCDMVNTDTYQFDSYEAELNNSMVSINILQLASELAENQTKIEMFDNDCLDEEEEEQMYVSHSDGTTSFDEEAQKIFDNLYDYYYNVILKCQ
jgi:hypothetical protein